MKLFLVTWKFLRELSRELQLLVLMLALPAFFMLIGYVGYGQTPKLATYTVLVQSTDPRSSVLVDTIRNQRHPDGRPAYRVQAVDTLSEADELLKRQEAALLLVFRTQTDGQMTLEVRGDATSMAYIIGSTRLGVLIGPQLDALTGKPQFLRWTEEQLMLNSPTTDFEIYTPGMMIFAILLLIPQAAMLLGREMRSGTLNRLRLTRLSTWELLGGVTLSQMVVGVLQVLAMVAMALGLGFHNQGSLLLAVGICLLLAVSAVGNGLWVAGFVKDDSQALNLGSVLTMLQVFLSGAWFVIPSEPLITIAGRGLGLLDLLPATHAMLALKQVLIGGAGPADVAFRTTAVAVLAVIYFLVGILLFRRKMA